MTTALPRSALNGSHRVRDGDCSLSARPSVSGEQAAAAAVKAFYESHPYPPPLASLSPLRNADDGRDRRRADFHLLWPGRAFRDDLQILVAGCGTSQAARYASRWPRSRVTGIDVSETSIRATGALKRKHGLANLDVLQLPVERAADLGARFDLIVCTGVLHHLPNPDVGLRALRDVLEPDGAMHLMVYAPYGRAGVYLLQEYARRIGVGSSPLEIRNLAEALRGLPLDHPLVPLLRNSPDFQSDDALADALLHPQDRPYSVPQFLNFLRNGGLRFNRWLRQAPYSPHCGALAASPHAAALQRLPMEEQATVAELFRGTMVRHSALAGYDNGPCNDEKIGFSTEGWLGYVPIRLPNTICVLDRLPSGSACVLINRSHTYTDLILALDKTGKELFEAVDGIRSIAEIAHQRSDLETARALFQQLWLYDHVAFEAPPFRHDRT